MKAHVRLASVQTHQDCSQAAATHCITLTCEQTADDRDIDLAHAEELEMQRSEKRQGLWLHEIPSNRSVQMQKFGGLHTRRNTLPWQNSSQVLLAPLTWKQTEGEE